MEYKTKAWIVTGILFLVLLTWTLVAVHDSAVVAARKNKTDASQQDGCPFSKAQAQPQESKKTSSCCHSDDSISKANSVKSSKRVAPKGFEKYADLDDDQLEEIMKQFTPEQLAKCPHLNAKKFNKKKN